MAQPIDNSAKQPNRQGSGFTNLQRFLDVNQKGRLGQAIGGGVQNVAQGTKQGIQQSGQQFTQQAEAQKLGTGQQQERVKSIIESAPTSVGYGNRSAEQQKNLQEFQKYTAGKYLGPQELQNYQTLQSQAQQAEQLGQMTGSAQGRTGLLQRFAGGPAGTYTQGQQNLDQLLLGQQKQPLQQAKQAAQGITQAAQQQQDAARLFAQNLTNQAQVFGKNVLGQVETKTSEADKPLAELYAAKQKEESSRRQAVQDIQDILSMKGTADVFDPKTGAVIRKGEAAAGDSGAALTKALNIAGQQGMLSREGVTRLEDIARKIQTPIERMVSKKVITGAPGLLGYGGAAKGQTYEYAATPTTSGLELRNLLRDRLLLDQSQNLSRGGLSTADQRLQLNALASLANKQGEFGDNIQQYRAGMAGFDIDAINRDVDEKIAQLRAEKLTAPDEYQATPISDRIRRSLAPTADEATADLGQGITNLTKADASLGERAAGLGEIVTNPARANLGAKYSQLTNTAEDLNRSYNDIIKAKNFGDVAGGLAGAATSTGANLGTAGLTAGLGPLGNQFVSTADLANAYKGGANQILGASNFGDVISGLGKVYSAPVVTAAAGFERIGNTIQRIPVVSSIGSAIGGAARGVGGFVKKLFSDENVKKKLTDAGFDIQELLDNLEPKNYEYKDSSMGAGKKTGIIAQDLEKSDLGKRFVENTSKGKMVDYGSMMETLLASQAHLNKRLNEIEENKKK